jgi:hypothetical protein
MISTSTPLVTLEQFNQKYIILILLNKVNEETEAADVRNSLPSLYTKLQIMI